MAYATANTPQNRMTAIVTVGAIHAGLGALLIYGLTTGGFAPPKDPPISAGQIPIEPPPPPPEPTPEPTQTQDASSRSIVAPKPPISIPTSAPRVDTSDIILPPTPPVPNVIPSALPTIAPPLPPPPSPTPSFDAVPARPANNPGGWVTQADYRTSWISRDYAGTVGFRVSVGASGRVEGCSVTRSSGVSALDEATCQLVTRRARFDPAKNDQGRATAGKYTGAVRWQLPD
ncbi:TonB family protein [Citromicrobium bathyomarinum]|uniref:energy transducer TonB n=1 Tax=Citromicrobium bathyomarinum TaxID=72174 RepID=UPI00315A1DEB